MIKEQEGDVICQHSI